jgi:riboflavin kinase/FMN adenylyltransferase
MIVTSSLNRLVEKHGVHRVAVACGVFDGVHRGHQAIIRNLVVLARSTGALPGLMTFDPHPRAVVQGSAPPLLTGRDHQLSIFEELGIEVAVVIPFTREIAELSADEFLDLELLVDGIDLTGICVGSTWRFGAGGRGTTATLEHWGNHHGFHVESVPELDWYGKPISSTRIRQAIYDGNLSKAEKMLGRPYAVRGDVVHGRGIGHECLECPTANLVTTEVLLPPCGVYAAEIVLEPEEPGAAETREHDGIVYIGTAPSFETPHDQPVLECHLFDFHRDIYGSRVEARFRGFIRGDKRFESVDALSAQIARDIEIAKKVLGS